MGKHLHIELTIDQRTGLEQLIHAGNAPAHKQTRAHILLLSDRSRGHRRTDQEVADAVLCSTSTIRNIQRRFVAGGLPAALNNKGWPGATAKFTGEVEAKLTLLACSDPPEGAARWTLRLLAGQMIELGYVEHICHVTVRELLKKQAQALAREVVVHRQAIGAVRRQDGGRTGCLCPALRCQAPSGMSG